MPQLCPFGSDSAATDWFRMVISGFAKLTLRLLYVPAGTFRLASSADSACRCSSSISSGSRTIATAGLLVSLGCRLAPVTVISKLSTITPAGGLSCIVRLAGAIAGPPGGFCDIMEFPPHAPSISAEKAAKENSAIAFRIAFPP